MLASGVLVDMPCSTKAPAVKSGSSCKPSFGAEFVLVLPAPGNRYSPMILRYHMGNIDDKGG